MSQLGYLSLMSSLFEELDYSLTPIGPISLRRRRELSLGVDVFEIKLGEEFLMSSLFTASEKALASLALEALSGEALEIAVGGLGLGYTAQAILQSERVSSLVVVELLQEVIDWHERGLLPISDALVNDHRCRILPGDFFHLATQRDGFDENHSGRQFDAILLDVDHSPKALLDGRSSSFYRPESLSQLANHIKPGGVFALWSDDQPDPQFTETLLQVFRSARGEPVTFHNPLLHKDHTQTVYIGRKE